MLIYKYLNTITIADEKTVKLRLCNKNVIKRSKNGNENLIKIKLFN
ncbi:hypothetical protein J2W55_002481 [Mucilaginibacter pocheonensis]|uniref:Uncharacterized protein n=1 Tax=Mucilaginibacter pocheonensis TaxID=398050 RepID=A0ABU1TB74_9SPHI|nr:hypothetical protein [Mucilaginibacter pocheonensis]